MRSSAAIASLFLIGMLVVAAWLFGGFTMLRRTSKPSRSRPSAPVCAVERGPGKPRHQPSSKCQTDAECTTGKNGRCQPAADWGRMIPVDECTYDACLVDNDCGPNALCECGHDATTEGGGVHHCVPAECRTDADCGSQACSPSIGLCMRGYSSGKYYCHTVLDECRQDSDCPRPRSSKRAYGPVDVRCGYSTATRRWVCMSEECPVG